MAIPAGNLVFRLTTQDTQFLKALKISVEHKES